MGWFGAIWGHFWGLSLRPHPPKYFSAPKTGHFQRTVGKTNTPRDTGFFGPLGRVWDGPGQVAATLRSAGPANDRPGHPGAQNRGEWIEKRVRLKKRICGPRRERSHSKVAATVRPRTLQARLGKTRKSVPEGLRGVAQGAEKAFFLQKMATFRLSTAQQPSVR